MDKPEIRTICVDFDQTLTHDTPYDGVKYGIGEANIEMIEAVKLAHEEGNKIIIFTARPSNEYYLLIEFLTKYEVPYSFIEGKPLARYYVDDKAIQPNEFIKLYGRLPDGE